MSMSLAEVRVPRGSLTWLLIVLAVSLGLSWAVNWDAPVLRIWLLRAKRTILTVKGKLQTFCDT